LLQIYLSTEPDPFVIHLRNPAPILWALCANVDQHLIADQRNITANNRKMVRKTEL